MTGKAPTMASVEVARAEKSVAGYFIPPDDQTSRSQMAAFF
jgi:hypothetical protein